MIEEHLQECEKCSNIFQKLKTECVVDTCLLYTSTLRPLKENGQWGAKCRKAYDLDENGQRIPDGKGGWKNHREDTTD